MVRESPYPIEDVAGPAEHLIMEGGYLAVVSIQWEADHGWGPTISAEDAFKLERVRKAMKRGDLAAAKRDQNCDATSRSTESARRTRHCEVSLVWVHLTRQSFQRF